MNYGQRVQHSVFKWVIDATQPVAVRRSPEESINPSTDSLRFCNLGNNYKSRVEHIGAKPSSDMEGTLIV